MAGAKGRVAPRLVRALLIAIAAGCVAFMGAEIAGISDLYSFESSGILRLVGLSGLTMILGLNIALAVLLARVVYALRGRAMPYPLAANVILALGAVLALWAYDCLFMEEPLEQRIALLFRTKHELVLNSDAQSDFAAFSIVRGAANPAAVERLRVMYERTRINNPGVYAKHPIGATIDKYATRYDVDPAILFFLNYIDSWYGESSPGPVPFLRAMSPETVRDFVQAHLPGWFVENGLRRTLITSPFLVHVFGEGFGFKLRYAFHKATLDVSISPYALNTYSDIFLVLRDYPEAFPEIFTDARKQDPIATAAYESFEKLRSTALIPPYELPYTHAAYNDAYYNANRRDLKAFTRAVYYLTLLDFDFATRLQALLTRHERDYYVARLGADRWAQLPGWQRAALLVMVRDLYTGNVGHLAYNLYALPELNVTPAEWVSGAALAEGGLPQTDKDPVWRPRHYEFLWAGAGYRLRVFSDVWNLAHGAPFPGIAVEETQDEARREILAVTGR